MLRYGKQQAYFYPYRPQSSSCESWWVWTCLWKATLLVDDWISHVSCYLYLSGFRFCCIISLSVLLSFSPLSSYCCEKSFSLSCWNSYYFLGFQSSFVYGYSFVDYWLFWCWLCFMSWYPLFHFWLCFLAEWLCHLLALEETEFSLNLYNWVWIYGIGNHCSASSLVHQQTFTTRLYHSCCTQSRQHLKHQCHWESYQQPQDKTHRHLLIFYQGTLNPQVIHPELRSFSREPRRHHDKKSSLCAWLKTYTRSRSHRMRESVGTCILHPFLVLSPWHILLILLLFYLFLVSIIIVSLIYYDISGCSYSYSSTRIFITNLTHMLLFTLLFLYATLFHTWSDMR